MWKLPIGAGDVPQGDISTDAATNNFRFRNAETQPLPYVLTSAPCRNTNIIFGRTAKWLVYQNGVANQIMFANAPFVQPLFLPKVIVVATGSHIGCPDDIKAMANRLVEVCSELLTPWVPSDSWFRPISLWTVLAFEQSFVEAELYQQHKRKPMLDLQVTYCFSIESGAPKLQRKRAQCKVASRLVIDVILSR